MQNIVSKYYLASTYLVTDVVINNALSIDPSHYELLLIKAFNHYRMQTYIEGPVTRLQKTDFIADSRIVQKWLSVCWPRPYNSCNICPKCVRTLVDLDSLGKLDYFSKIFDIEHYKKYRDWYHSYVLTEFKLGSIFFIESVKRLKNNGVLIEKTFEDRIADILPSQYENIISYCVNHKIKSVYLVGRSYYKFVDLLANALTENNIYVYCNVQNRKGSPCTVKNKFYFVDLEHLSPEISSKIDTIIPISLTLNFKCFEKHFKKLGKQLSSGVHLSEIMEIPFFSRKEEEVKLNKKFSYLTFVW